jgi:hypothetical protein
MEAPKLVRIPPGFGATGGSTERMSFNARRLRRRTIGEQTVQTTQHEILPAYEERRAMEAPEGLI